MFRHRLPPAVEPSSHAVDLFAQALQIDRSTEEGEEAYHRLWHALALELRIPPWEESPLDVGDAPEPPPPPGAENWKVSDWKATFMARQMRAKLRAALTARRAAEPKIAG
jgi:hypothetical protein